ncbi:hypothetical protein FHS89_003097 [Rubricella aquisinus]|uniref:Oxidoreductase n=1 Tax=Rubricella aquisinus TaxID=2028108 RepID=A0A840WSS0_9RHOB|nr:oxidoreductase [Rubricella aquisinus]MBB5517053.1 hypothetical protein [Rubricella aquisinus]
MINRLWHITAVIAALVGFSTLAQANTMEAPSGAPILTITGDIGTTNMDDSLVLDREMLAAIDATTLQTSTIWTEGVQQFEGVSLHALVAFLNVESGTIRATAINDYTVEIPVTDAVEGGPIIAYLMDGQTMSIRDKGPLWVIYPYDSSSDYRSEVTYARSIWQLDRLEFVQ